MRTFFKPCSANHNIKAWHILILWFAQQDLNFYSFAEKKQIFFLVVMSGLLRKEGRVEEEGTKVKTRKKELYNLRIRILLALSIYGRRVGLYRQYKERHLAPKAAEILPEMQKNNGIPVTSALSIPIVPPPCFPNISGNVCESSYRGHKPGIPCPPLLLVMTDKRS